MQNLKNKAVRILSILTTIILISELISGHTLAASMKTVHGSVEKGKIKIELTSDNVADTIIINLFTDEYFAKQFVGYNYVYPGLNFTGDFMITNNTGQTYKVTGFSFEADVAYIRRVYNDAAKSKYGDMTSDNKEIVKNLSGEEWYQLNSEHYGLENFYKLEVAREILGYGETHQGLAVGVETSSEMITLGKWYLFNRSQFSFDTYKYPINNFDIENIALQDYIDKTPNNIDLVLGSCFSQEIGENGFTSTIGYSIDNDSVGNAYNGAYSDFKFTLTLSRVIKSARVSYNGNGNTGGIAPSDNNLYESGSSVIVLDNIGHLVKEGFVFDGWNTSPDGSGMQLQGEDSFFIDSDITLYALWLPVATPSPPTPPPTTPPPTTPTPPPTTSTPPPTTPTPPPTKPRPKPKPKPKPTLPPTRPIPPQVTSAEIIVPDTPPSDLAVFRHIKYIYGYPDGLVRADNVITRSEVASIFFRLLTDSNKNDFYPSTFYDVSDDNWYAQAVNYLAYIGVITGYEDRAFRPNASITRAEFAAIASRFDDLATTDENVFLDVPSDHWARRCINSAYKEGWINVYDNGIFEPDHSITRIEVIKLVNSQLNRLVNVKDLDDSLNPFSDLTRDYWGFVHILEASLDHLYTKSDDGSEIWMK